MTCIKKLVAHELQAFFPPFAHPGLLYIRHNPRPVRGAQQEAFVLLCSALPPFIPQGRGNISSVTLYVQRLNTTDIPVYRT